jgi:hypothetical protein
MKLKTILLGSAAALTLMSSSAMAGSVSQPGETSGVDLATPLPEGVYFVNTLSYGGRPQSDAFGGGTKYEGVNIPVIAWSTPWTIFGGRVQALFAAPELDVGNNSQGYFSAGMYNPFLASWIGWNLGNGFSFSYLAGVYIAIDGGDFRDAFNQNTFRQDLSFAYHNNGWNLVSNLRFGIVGDNLTTHLANPDYFNYEVSLTHTFGKWEVGLVTYGSTDVGNGPTPTYLKQSQFAMGGFAAYNFGPVIAQLYLTTDVYEQNYGGNETRLWTRLIVPVWTPDATKVVTAKY